MVQNGNGGGGDVITRVHAQYMEARGALGAWDPGEQRIHAPRRRAVPHRVRTRSPQHPARPEHQIRVIVGDVAAASARRAGQYPEHRQWCCGRPQARAARQVAAASGARPFPPTSTARDNVTEAELALDATAGSSRCAAHAGQRRRLRVVGPQSAGDLQQHRDPGRRLRVSRRPRARDLGAHQHELDGAVPRRRRPEATYVIERSSTTSARELGVGLRRSPLRKNLVPASARAVQDGHRVTYDCGDFRRRWRPRSSCADVAGFPARRAAAAGAARLRGLGVANAIERAAGHSPSSPRSASRRAAAVTVLRGRRTRPGATRPTFKQFLHERLGSIRPDVRYIDGDTDRVASHWARWCSRSTVIGGHALWTAADKVVAKGRRIAAKLLDGRARPTIKFENGAFSVVAPTARWRSRRSRALRSSPPRCPRVSSPLLRDRDVFASVRHVAERLPRLRGRGRSRDGRGHPRRLRHRRRRRHRDQSADLKGQIHAAWPRAWARR